MPKPYRKNPRKITHKQLENLESTLAELGDLSGIVHDLNTDEIIGGNQRSKVFRLDECEIVLTEEYAQADEQGTVGLGFVVWRGKRYAYRAVRWDERTAEKANIVANRAGGEWDFEMLATEFSAPDLVSWGFEPGEVAFEMEAGEEPSFDAAEKPPVSALVDRFIVPPFSVLDARQGYWVERKRAWLALGLKGELGRGTQDKKERGLVFAASAQSPAIYELRNTMGRSSGIDPSWDEILEEAQRLGMYVYGGTSVFDPVLSELLYRWFMPAGGHVLNPMSGEAVHGLVAAYLGYRFTGVELRAEQAESNREQAREIGVDPVWITADALTIDQLGIDPADFVVSCPPYADLEVYSDNPLDLSTMDYKDFIAVYSEIIKKSCDLLVENRFAAFVVGEVRDKNGVYYDFVGDTIKAFKSAGLKYYNEMILITQNGSVAMRAGKQFVSSRKIGKTHQNVLVFLKGDAKKAVADCGAIEVWMPDESD